MNKRVRHDLFRKMALELANSSGFIKEVAVEFGINQSLLSKRKQRESGDIRIYKKIPKHTSGRKDV